MSSEDVSCGGCEMICKTTCIGICAGNCSGNSTTNVLVQKPMQVSIPVVSKTKIRGTNIEYKVDKR